MFESTSLSALPTLEGIIPSGMILSAGLTGLLASGHCVNMCGGISISLSQATQNKAWLTLLLPHLKRISCYTLMGFISYICLQGALKPNPNLINATRILPALALLGLGLVLLVKNKKTSAMACQHCRSCPQKKSSSPTRWLSWCWGLIPCPMVLTMLIASLASSTPWHAAAFMAAFGVGTLPGLLGLGVLSRHLSGHFSKWHLMSRKNQTATLLILAGIWTGAGTWLMGEQHQHHNNQHHSLHQHTHSSAYQPSDSRP